MYSIVIYIFLFLNCFPSCQTNNNIAYNIPDPDCTGAFSLCVDADKDRLGREAIKVIHEQMDDDKDGMIEASESSDFIKEELESQADSIRHRHFQNATIQITLNDLWMQWQKSAIYNWSNDDVINWLVKSVHLPMYVENFRRNQIDGRMIPRLAANQRHYLSAIMQIRDPRHKRRLIIKSTDVVLFGPPQHTHNLIKDIILMSAVLISCGACLYAYIRHRKTQESMKSMLKELETLQAAEGDLVAVTGKMKAMENELQDKVKVERGVLNSWYMEVQRTKDEADKYRKHRERTLGHESQLHLAMKEIEQLRVALRQAEEHAHYQSYDAPSELIDLLKRTYHIEEIAFEVKRRSAESAMLAAKDQMNKISKMQRGFFGAVRIAHTGCMDNISELISSAKQRLAIVQDECEEREKRWNRISSILDREDLINYSSSLSSTTMPISGNQYLSGISHTPSNNGINNSLSSDTSSRSKRTPVETSSLLSANNDSQVMRRTNSNINIRRSATNTLLSSSTGQQDTKNEINISLEHSNPSSATLRRRAIANSALSSDRSSADRLLNTTTLVYSYSTNGLHNLDTNSVESNTSDSADTLLSSSSTVAAPQTKSFVGTIADFHLDNCDSIFDDNIQCDATSQMSDFVGDDQQSIASSEKSRRLAQKLFRPFQNMRLGKKANLT
ncbi:unnamed protein product [Rotaria magnacalcarata]|uniref:SAM domain-containing protein n=2 Tax=Rotaria magnacalcarata TaxID=392030 RepID=A0A815DEZ9_9BILA|nr:unnamed protein product [Rotaria magnacalcarata]CAF1653524.1 unnamed protein product [Rotaria magnacalcarata]CAF2099318.1 unnamed protein product [Rotaria magnacalcarata]CAF2144377.1 unnamed protein product [Rotaria magnacalcarata]CAF2157822.1 unnamed protein product [Rotaria magnacalcarata]